VRSPSSNGRAARARRVATGTMGAAVLAGLLTGCGGGSSKAHASGPSTTAGTTPALSLPADMAQKPACGMITGAEVEAAIGAKVGPPKEEAQQGRSLCSFTLAGKTDESIVVLSTTSSGVPAFFATTKAKADGPQTVAAGDEAFVSGVQGLVRKGNTMVAVLVILHQPAGQLTADATKLVQAVANHI
jgi:hypothetical protein